MLESKRHFQILDGLRGVAALAIVVFHFMEIVYSPSQNFIGHGFLAVDFFFCLSGFVIAYAYDDRIQEMGKGEFFKRRLIRLHPLVILGSVLGLLAFLFHPFGGAAETYSAGRILLIFTCSLLLIPFPVMEDRFFNLFGLNAPAWSLFWEYVANLAYVFILRKMARHYLILLALLMALALFYVAYHSDSVMGGWSGDTFWDGGARIGYSFLAGMLICRSNWVIRTKLGFFGLSLLLLSAFLLPFFAKNWLVELAVVLFYFPLIVSLGAGTYQDGRLTKVCTFSGNISYPLYMTHYAVMWVFADYYNNNHPGTSQLAVIIGIGTVLLLAFAYLVMKIYDIPLRRYLSRKWR